MRLRIWEYHRWAPNQLSSPLTSLIYTRNFQITRETHQTLQHPSATPTTKTWHLVALRKFRLKSLSTGLSWNIKETRWVNQHSNSKTVYQTSTIEKQMAPTCKMFKMRAVATTLSNRMQTASVLKSQLIKTLCLHKAKVYTAHSVATWILQANSSQLWTSNRSNSRQSTTNWRILRRANLTRPYKIYKTSRARHSSSRLKTNMNMRSQGMSSLIIIEKLQFKNL